ncbi:glycosyltransferase [Enterococcus faecalis]|nr:glycosyltransferase [Enterococcus faecalis]
MLKIFFPNKKIIINVHGSDVIAQTNIQQILQRLFLQKFLTMALYIVVPSNYFKEVMIYKYRQPAERIVVSSSAGVDTKIFFPKKKNSQIISIGYVGRIDAKKRWDLAILAVKTLQQQQSNQEIRFVMVGDGKENEAKEHLITTSKLTEITECKKLLSQNKLATVYQSLDVLIFPSEQESLGLVGLEAMSCGIPVIGNDIPGISSYLIHGYNGFLFKRNNLESLVDQLKKFCCLTISEKELLAYNAFKTSQNYSKKVVKQEVKILLNQVFSNEI